MGSARRYCYTIGSSLLIMAMLLAVGTGVVRGSGTKVGDNAYEVGSATAAPGTVHIGDMVRVEGTGMLKNADVMVIFGVRVSEEMIYAVDVGMVESDANGNWSINAQVPASVEVIVAGALSADSVQQQEKQQKEAAKKTPAELAAVRAAMTANGNAQATATGLLSDGDIRSYQPSVAGVSDGDWVSVYNGMWQYAGFTIGNDGAVYGTNTNFIEVTDNVVATPESTPNATPASKTASYSTLPATGWSAIIIAACGALMLAAGFIISRRAD